MLRKLLTFRFPPSQTESPHWHRRELRSYQVTCLWDFTFIRTDVWNLAKFTKRIWQLLKRRSGETVLLIWFQISFVVELLRDSHQQGPSTFPVPNTWVTIDKWCADWAKRKECRCFSVPHHIKAFTTSQHKLVCRRQESTGTYFQ